MYLSHYTFTVVPLSCLSTAAPSFSIHFNYNVGKYVEKLEIASFPFSEMLFHVHFKCMLSIDVFDLKQKADLGQHLCDWSPWGSEKCGCVLFKYHKASWYVILSQAESFWPVLNQTKTIFRQVSVNHSCQPLITSYKRTAISGLLEGISPYFMVSQ